MTLGKQSFNKSAILTIKLLLKHLKTNTIYSSIYIISGIIVSAGLTSASFGFFDLEPQTNFKLWMIAFPVTLLAHRIE